MIHRIFSGIVWVFKRIWQLVVFLFKKFFNPKEYFTLVIVPHAPLKNVKSVKFPKWIVSSFVIIITAAVTVVCSYAVSFSVSYHSLNNRFESKTNDYQALQNAKEDEEKQLNEYKSNDEEIKKRIQVLKDLENKLNDIIESKGGKPQSSSVKTPKLASRSTSLQPPGDISDPEIEFESIQEMNSTVDELAAEIDSRVQELDNAIKKEEDRLAALRAIPSVFPVGGYITSTFGYRRDPFTGIYDLHTGVDIAGARGTPIRAAGDGVVVEAGWDSGGYGILVKINHGNGYQSLYGHNSKVAVKVGQRVQRGDTIAYMGSTGRSTGTHSHFEVRYNGTPINPYKIKQ